MKVMLLLTFLVDMVFLSESNREPFYYFNKNYSTYSRDFYTYSYHYGKDADTPPVPHNPDISSPKHERSFSSQNEKRNAEPRQESREIDDEFPIYDEDRSPDAIVYPTNRPTTIKRRDNDIRGHNCTFDLCETADDYPYDYIKRLFDRTRKFDAFFNTTPVLETRFDEGFVNLCRSTVTTNFPRSAINKNKIKRYIPNYDNYQQGVRVETCMAKDKPCELGEMLPFGYETKCEQRFTTVVLLALDDNKEPIADTFLSPSCCVCTYKTGIH